MSFTFRKMAVGAVAVAMSVAAPLASHAAGCVPGAPQPAPHAGSTTQSLMPADSGTAWYWTNPAGAGEAGIKGTHGFLVVSGDTTNGLKVRGSQNESKANGSLTVSPSGGTNGAPSATVCVSNV